MTKATMAVTLCLLLALSALPALCSAPYKHLFASGEEQALREKYGSSNKTVLVLMRAYEAGDRTLDSPQVAALVDRRPDFRKRLGRLFAAPMAASPKDLGEVLSFVSIDGVAPTDLSILVCVSALYSDVGEQWGGAVLELLDRLRPYERAREYSPDIVRALRPKREGQTRSHLANRLLARVDLPDDLRLEMLRDPDVEPKARAWLGDPNAITRLVSLLDMAATQGTDLLALRMLAEDLLPVRSELATQALIRALESPRHFVDASGGYFHGADCFVSATALDVWLFNHLHDGRALSLRRRRGALVATNRQERMAPGHLGYVHDVEHYFDEAYGMTVRIPQALMSNGSPSDNDPPDWPFVPEPTPPADPVFRAGGDVTHPVEISRVAPTIPEDCQASTFTAAFIFEAVIDRDGTVRGVRALSRPNVSPPCPHLVNAFRRAIFHRRYRPATLHDKPVAAYLIVTVHPSSLSR